MLKKLLIFLTLITVVFVGTAFAADGDYIIRTWGYGDIMYNMILATKQLIGTDNYKIALKLAFVMCMIVFLISYVSERGFNTFALGQKVIFVILMQVLISSSPHSAWITDMTTGEPARRIDNVPAVIGLPLDVISNIEYSLSEALKDSLGSTPGGIAAGNSMTIGITTALNMLQATSTYRLGDPFFTRTMQSFVERCIMPDIISGYSDIYEIGTGPNFWGAWNSTHPARIANIFRKGEINGIDGEIKSCPYVYTYLTTELNKYTNTNGDAWKQIAGSMGLTSGEYISRNIGAISKYTFDYNQDAQSLLMNSIAINEFNDAYAQIATTAGLDASALSYGISKAKETARMNSTMSAIMAKQYLPMAKSYLTVIIVAIIPLIFIIAIATGNIQKPVAMIGGLLVALALWTIGDQLLDYIITVRTQSTLGNMTGGLFNLQTQPIIEQGVLDSLSLSLGMYWMIPTLSFAIASMSGYAMNSVMGSVGQSTMVGVGAAASEAVTGSRSMGVIRENMISSNKYDAASSLQSGTQTGYKDLNKQEIARDASRTQNTVNEMNNRFQEIDSKEYSENGMNWKGTNNERIGVGTNSNGDFQMITQYKDADGNWQNREVETAFKHDTMIDGKEWKAGTKMTETAEGRVEVEGVSGDGKAQATYSRGSDGKLHGELYRTEGGEFHKYHGDTYEQVANKGAMNLGGQYVNGSGVKFTQYGKGEDSMLNGTFIGNDGVQYSFSGKGISVLSGEDLQSAALKEMKAGNTAKAEAMLSSNTYFDGDISLSSGASGHSNAVDNSHTNKSGNSSVVDNSHTNKVGENFSIGNADIAALASGDVKAWEKYTSALLAGDGSAGVIASDLNAYTSQNYMMSNASATERADSGFSFNAFGLQFSVSGSGVKEDRANAYSYGLGQVVGQLNKSDLNDEQKALVLAQYQQEWIGKGENLNNSSVLENAGRSLGKATTNSIEAPSNLLQEGIYRVEKWLDETPLRDIRDQSQQWMEDKTDQAINAFNSGVRAGKQLWNDITK